MTKRTIRLAALVAAVIVVSSSCYTLQVDEMQAADPTVKPWFCNPTAPNSVTGPGMGTVNFYAGQTRSPLGWEDCRTLAAQMDLAKGYAEQYPTRGRRRGRRLLPVVQLHHRHGHPPRQLRDDHAGDPRRPELQPLRSDPARHDGHHLQGPGAGVPPVQRQRPRRRS